MSACRARDEGALLRGLAFLSAARYYETRLLLVWHQHRFWLVHHTQEPFLVCCFRIRLWATAMAFLSKCPRSFIGLEIHGDLVCGFTHRGGGKQPGPAPGSYNPSQSLTRSRSLGAITSRATRDTAQFFVRNVKAPSVQPYHGGHSKSSTHPKGSFNIVTRIAAPTVASRGTLPSSLPSAGNRKYSAQQHHEHQTKLKAQRNDGFYFQDKFYPNVVKRDLSREKNLPDWASRSTSNVVSPVVRSPLRAEQMRNGEVELTWPGGPSPAVLNAAADYNNLSAPTATVGGSSPSGGRGGAAFASTQGTLKNTISAYNSSRIVEPRPASPVHAQGPRTAFGFAPKPRNFYNEDEKTKNWGNAVVSSPATSTATSRVVGMKATPTTPNSTLDARGHMSKLKLQEEVRQTILRNREDLERRHRLLQQKRQEMATKKLQELEAHFQNSSTTGAPPSSRGASNRNYRGPAAGGPDIQLASNIYVQNLHQPKKLLVQAPAAGRGSVVVEDEGPTTSTQSQAHQVGGGTSSSSRTTPVTAGAASSGSVTFQSSSLRYNNSGEAAGNQPNNRSRGATKFLSHVMESKSRWDKHMNTLTSPGGVSLSRA